MSAPYYEGPAWSGFGPEPMTADEWQAWLRAAGDDELESVAARDGIDGAADAQRELDRREAERE